MYFRCYYHYYHYVVIIVVYTLHSYIPADTVGVLDLDIGCGVSLAQALQAFDADEIEPKDTRYKIQDTRLKIKD